MKICKECKEVTCIGCYETRCNKLKRKYRYLKWNIKEYIRKLYKRKNNNHEMNYEEDNENWKNYNIEWEWNENNEWENNSKDDENNKLEIKESFNFEEEVMKDINEVIICISEVPN
jgi:predicted RNase H-like nuclease (RuvC/YqgF family)